MYSPAAQYQSLVSSKQINFDPAQQQAVDLLQQLYLTLQPIKAKANERKISDMSVKGLYLWGEVGRGKTFLMDLLVNSLPSNVCKRQHFHHFMQDVHQQLNIHKGKADPLKRIAKTFSQQYKVLCFDEFFVSDIGDAMLLGNLLQFMFELNMIVICTSNCAPNELYKNGLQRERFLPAIAAINQHTQVIHLSGERDHRHRVLTHVQNYFELPTTELEQISLHQDLLVRFNLALTQDLDTVKGKALDTRLNTTPNTDVKSEQQIMVLGRNINYVAISNLQHLEHKDNAICFEFSQLCQGARSHFDYVEIAKRFSTILLFNVPPMSGQAYERIKARGIEDNGSNINISAGQTGEREVVLAPMDDAARRFIALVDECYDCRVNLVISAYVPQAELYNNGSLMFEFERTKSRLVEMASQEYLGN